MEKHTINDNARLISEGGVEIEFNGEKRVLWFSHAAYCALEQRLIDKGIIKALGDILNLQVSPEVTASVLWSGLMHYSDMKMTPEEVGETIFQSGGGMLSYGKYRSAIILALVNVGAGIETVKEVESKMQEAPLPRKRGRKA